MMVESAGTAPAASKLQGIERTPTRVQRAAMTSSPPKRVADSSAGHLIEHKEERDVLSRWGNDLRQS
jgi:hypothetical protein